MGVRPTRLWAWAAQHTRNLSRVALAVVVSLPLLMALGVTLWLVGPGDAGAQTSSPFYTLRVYGRGYYGAGADNVVDPGAGLNASVADPVTGAVPEDAPYTDLAGVFHPQHPQAPRMDSVTWNPAYMAEGFTFDENQRRGLYNQMFANGINIAEKVWHRIWYEPEHWDKDLNADRQLTRDPQTGRPRDPRLQNGLPVWLDDIWYPAIQQEFTYTLLENQEPVPRGSTKPEPVFGRAGTVQFVFPVGMRPLDLFDANGQVDASDAGNGGRGYGLTSLDADFDGVPDIVHVDSELTLFDKTRVAADFNGDGLLQGLRRGAGLAPDGSELAILHVNLSNRPLQVGQYAQFLDHLVRVSALYNDSVRLEFWYTGDLRPRYLGSQLLYVGDMALAGTQGPTQLISAGGNNLAQYPVGPWFAYVETVDTVDGTAALWLGRGLGAPFSAMEDGPGVPDRRPGDPWFLKRMYVDGHEYNVVAISARSNGATTCDATCIRTNGRPYDPSDFEFITLRQPIPKGPDILIAQHSVRLRGYQPDECLPKLPPYNYEHYILADIVQLDELNAAVPTPGAVNPTPTATPGSAENLIYYFGKLVGPVPPILQANAPFPYTTENGVYDNPRETKWSYRQETTEPSFLGALREKYGERPRSAAPEPGQPPTEFFYTEQFWTLPWAYTEFALPDLADARTGTRRDPVTGREVANPDLYLLTSAFRAPQGQYQLWTQDRATPFRWGDWPVQVDPPPWAAQSRVKFWFDPARSPDPTANPSGKIYRDGQGLRLYGKTFRDPNDFTGTAGDISVTRDANGYRVEVPPYTDPWAPFNPQLPQAPRKDSITFNPAYLDEFRNSNEALAALYGRISIEGADAREKVYFRQWYENSYLDKLRYESDRTRDYRFSALMQEFTYLFMDTQDRPAHAQPGNSRLALPMATGRDELPVPPRSAGVGWTPAPSFGYGLTSFDANFDGTPDIVTIDSEQSLYRKTGIRADFNGNGQVDSLRPAGAPDVDGLAIFSVENFVLRRGESLQFMDHLVTLKNIGVGGYGSTPTADMDFWYTGGGLHALGNGNYSSHPDFIRSASFNVGDMALAQRSSVRRLPAGTDNLGRTDGGWYLYVSGVNQFEETVVVSIGRALGATHAAIDDGNGGHNLAQPTPWYLKRFFVDGHEYNVVALQVVPRDPQNTQGEDWEFKYITFRTPVPKPNSFVNFQDSLVLQGYFRGAVLDNPDTNVISVLPPFNVPHTIAEDVVRITPTDFATNREHPRTDVVGALRGAGPMQIRIVGESTEPRFTGELRELLFPRDLPLAEIGSKRDIWSTEQFHVYPDRYTELRLPDDQFYLLTSDWTSPYSRLHFFAYEDTQPTAPGYQNSQNDIASAWAASNPGQTTAGIPFTNTDGLGPADFPVGGASGHIDFFNAEDRSVPTDPTSVRVKFVYSPRDTSDIYVNPGPPQQPCVVSPGTLTPTVTPCTGPGCLPTLTRTPTPTPCTGPGCAPTTTPTATPTVCLGAGCAPTVTPTATAQPPTGTPTQSPNLGAVTGVVFRDVNCDGVWQGGEPGLSGVTVTLVAPGPDNSFGTADDVVVATTTTDATGAYSFPNLPPGAYQVRETDLPGYKSSTPNDVVLNVVSGTTSVVNFGDCLTVTATSTLTPTATRTATPCVGPGCPATLTPTLTLEPGPTTSTPTATPRTVTPTATATATTLPGLGSITGVVFRDVNCNTVWEGGEPGLSGVTVTLIAPGPDNAFGTADDVLVAATTDSNGNYSFTNLPPGAYQVRETDPAGFVSSTPNLVVTTVVSGSTTIVNFGDCLALTPTPTPTVCVGPSCAPTLTPTLTATPTATLCTGPGCAPTTTPTATTPPSLGTVTGVVYRDVNCDGVRQGGDTGIPGVTVRLIGAGFDGVLGTADDTVVAVTTTDAAGAYTFTNVPAGVYDVRETDPLGYTSSTPNSVIVVIVGGGTAIANFGDCLASTGTPTPTPCVGPACAPTGTPTASPTVTPTSGPNVGAIIGVVYRDLNCDGIQQGGDTGIPGVTVTLYGPGPDGQIGTADDTVVAVTTTNANGAYGFSNLPTGLYEVRETDPLGYTSSTPNSVIVVVVGGGLTIANFGDCLTATVTPTLTATPTATPCTGPGCAPTVTPTLTASPTATLCAGPGCVPTVTPTLTATATRTPTVTPTRGPQPGTIIGVVYHDLNCDSIRQGGEPPLSGVTITLLATGPDNAFGTADDVVVAVTTTDATGAYLFSNVAPGVYMVRETDPAGYTSSTPNNVVAVVVNSGLAIANFGDCQSGATTPTPTPTPTATQSPNLGAIIGVVYRDLNCDGVQQGGDTGIPGVTVSLLTAGPDNAFGTADDVVVAVTTTDAAGGYRFANLTPGVYLVRETDPAGYTSSTPNSVVVTVVGGGVAVANFGDCLSVSLTPTPTVTSGLPPATRTPTPTPTATGPTPTPTATPTTPIYMVAACDAAGLSITVQWVAFGLFDGFELERTPSFPNGNPQTLDGRTMRFQDFQVSASISYSYRVRGVIGSARTDWSNTDGCTPRQPAPQPPSLDCRTVSASLINVSWQVPDLTAIGIRVERSRNGVNWTQITDQPRGASPYRDSGLQDNTLYFYRARTYRTPTGLLSDYSTTVSCQTPPRNDDVTGTVLLQGRNNHAGARVLIDRGTAGFAITDDQGAFNIAGTPFGRHTVEIDMAGYLPISRTIEVVSVDTPLGVMNMLAGDANNDLKVDLFDLTIVASAYDIEFGAPGWDNRADINGDGAVNIFDLVLVSQNFGLRGPTDGTLAGTYAGGGVADASAKTATTTAPTAHAHLVNRTPQTVYRRGDRLTVAVELDNLTDFYGGAIDLVYDPAVLSVVDQNAAQSGVQVKPGDLFPATAFFAPRDQALTRADGKHVVRFAGVRREAAPVSGQGVLVEITFEVSGCGATTLDLAQADLDLSNPAGEALPVTLDGTVPLGGSYCLFLPMVQSGN